jgi:hypothetical protein
MCANQIVDYYTMLNIQISINKGLWLYFNTKFFSKFNDLNDNAIIIVRFQMSKFIRNAVTLLTQWSGNFQMSKLISNAVPLFTQWSGNFQMSKLIALSLRSLNLLKYFVLKYNQRPLLMLICIFNIVYNSQLFDLHTYMF